MPEITLERVTKRWGKFYAVDGLDLVIHDNEFVTLLGPSGCGKTTILRMIAGLETPTEGRIAIGGRVVFDSALGINVPANKRKVGFLFQNYALWPNMTVRENIGFGLENIKEELPKIDFEARETSRLSEILSSPEEAARIIREGGDSKRVIARLTEAFNISGFTAKKLLGYNVEKGKGLDDKAKSLRQAAESAVAEKGLNERFEYVRDGKTLTEVRKLTKEEIDLTVRRVARLVKIGMFMDRYPAELSGGQQQRVAIARTLAPEPSVLFMDEPLSNLDAKLRLEMRYELQRLHVGTGSTFVYVTHDQMEAMTLATRICLLNNGMLQQYAPPLVIYHEPANTFAADFVGNPSINFVEAQGENSGNGKIDLKVFGRKASFEPTEPIDFLSWRHRNDEAEKLKAEELKLKSASKDYVEKSNKDVPFECNFPKATESDSILPSTESKAGLILGIRPESVSVTENGPLCGEIYGAMPTGMETTIKVRIADLLLTGVAFGSSVFNIGYDVKVDIAGNNVMLFDKKSGKRIANGRLTFPASV